MAATVPLSSSAARVTVMTGVPVSPIVPTGPSFSIRLVIAGGLSSPKAGSKVSVRVTRLLLLTASATWLSGSMTATMVAALCRPAVDHGTVTDSTLSPPGAKGAGVAQPISCS